MKVQAKVDLSRFKALAATVRKQIPFATAQALTETAEDYHKVATVLMRQTLDRPIPFTQKGLRVGKAAKNRLEASVYMLPVQSSYMRLQIEGGVDAGEKPLPTRRTEDRYGNLAKNAIQKAIASGKGFTVETRLGGDKMTFVRFKSGKKPAKGAYRRKSRVYGFAVTDRWRGLKKIAGSTAVRHYRALYPFYDRAESRMPVVFERVFGKHLARAIASAKR